MTSEQFDTVKEDMRRMTEARLAFFLQHIRFKNNEWLLEEMHEFGCAVNDQYYHMVEADLVTKEQYQKIVVIARMGWAELKLIVMKVEELCLPPKGSL